MSIALSDFAVNFGKKPKLVRFGDSYVVHIDVSALEDDHHGISCNGREIDTVKKTGAYPVRISPYMFLLSAFFHK